MNTSSVNQRKRFERWRRTLPAITSFFVDEVIEKVVSKFEARGFSWYPDYASGDVTHVGANQIFLQQRAGTEWPTVEIRFDKRSRPICNVEFATLPLICRRWDGDSYVEVPRERAAVIDAPAYFGLCDQEKGNYYCQFGYRWFAIFPRSKILGEIARMERLLPDIFDVFEQGIPNNWIEGEFGFVSPHIMNLTVRMDKTRGPT